MILCLSCIGQVKIFIESVLSAMGSISRRHFSRYKSLLKLLEVLDTGKATKRIYLFGQVRVTTRLVEEALDAGYYHLIETNGSGKRLVQVNLSGTLQEASAHLYAAWLVAKDPERKGTTISREMLSELWQVSVPTLLSVEISLAEQRGSRCPILVNVISQTAMLTKWMLLRLPQNSIIACSIDTL